MRRPAALYFRASPPLPEPAVPAAPGDDVPLDGLPPAPIDWDEALSPAALPVGRAVEPVELEVEPDPGLVVAPPGVPPAPIDPAEPLPLLPAAEVSGFDVEPEAPPPPLPPGDAALAAPARAATKTAATMPEAQGIDM